jgi:hypothetical protein
VTREISKESRNVCTGSGSTCAASREVEALETRLRNPGLQTPGFPSPDSRNTGRREGRDRHSIAQDLQGSRPGHVVMTYRPHITKCIELSNCMATLKHAALNLRFLAETFLVVPIEPAENGTIYGKQAGMPIKNHCLFFFQERCPFRASKAVRPTVMVRAKIRCALSLSYRAIDCHVMKSVLPSPKRFQSTPKRFNCAVTDARKSETPNDAVRNPAVIVAPIGTLQTKLTGPSYGVA